MKFKRKSIILSKINYINFLFFSFQLLFKYIYCECDLSCTSGSCKEALVELNLEKKYCCDLISSPDNYFYIHEKYGETHGTCKTLHFCQDKVVESSLQCVPECFHYYEVGDFCKKTITDDYIPIIDLPNKKKYKCKGYTYIKLIGGKEYHQCFQNFDDCPTLYYDSDEKLCVKSCENKKIVVSNGESQKYECRNECKYSEDEGEIKEFEYHKYDKNDGTTKIYCLQECPNDKPYFYKIMKNKSPLCKEDCEEKHFYNSIKQCFTSCDKNIIPESQDTDFFYYYLKDNSKDYFYCEKNTIGCPTQYPFQYKNHYLCLKSCSDTQLITIILKKKTYSYTISDRKYCVDDCYNENHDYYSDEDSLSCVEDCSQTKNKFHYEHKCKFSCPKEYAKYYLKYKIDSPSTGEIDNVYKEMECVSSCPTGFYLYDNTICLKICPKSSDMPFINTGRNKCTTCNIPDNPLDVQEGEGFLDNEELKENKDNIVCMKKCPSNTYYKKNNNICYPLPSQDDTCYFPFDDLSICYPSCKDIDKGEYKYEYKNICYNTNICEDNNKYYYKIGNSFKCINDEVVAENERMKIITRECEKQNYIYLNGKECISDCSNTDYKIEPIETIYKGVEVLGKCCSNPNCDNDYKFYSVSERILRKECSFKKIEKEYDEIGVSKEGTCVPECPSDYPYESKDGKTCLSKCPYYFYNVGESKSRKCVDNCKSINRYNFEDSKECLPNCSKKDENNNKITYYYYDESNICYYLCKYNKNDSNIFSLKINNDSPQKCRSSCPEGYYYYESDYLCLQSCSGGYYTSSNICVTQCSSKEVVINNNTTCSQQCSSEEPFLVFDEESKNNLCVRNCTIYNEKYKYYHNKSRRCLEECPPDFPYIYGKQCVDKCPEELYTDLEKRECTTKCNSYFVKDGNGYKCVDKCDLSEYYISSTMECVKKCGKYENYIGKNRKCKFTCDKEEDGEYYKKIDEVKKENSEEILYYIYLCLHSYGSYKPSISSINQKEEIEYLVHGTNEIVINECPSHKPFLSEKGNICYSKCIDSEDNSEEALLFSSEENGIKKCSFECKGTKLNYGADKICKSGCDDFEIINDENNECVDKCDLTSSYKFQTKKSEGDNRLYCSNKCEFGAEVKYSEFDYKCLENCKEPYNYQDGNICRYECPKNKFIQIKDEEKRIYECKEQCDGDYKYYYEKNRKCIKEAECYYIIQGTFECITDCSLIKKDKNYYFYEYYLENDNILPGYERSYFHHTCVLKCPPEKPFLKENNHCANECNKNSYPYYIEEEKKCLPKCPPDMVIDGYACKNACPKDKFLNPKTKECINNCNITNYKYYYPPNNTCIEKCDKLLYKNNHKCVESCPNDENDTDGKKKLYVNSSNECSSKCPETHKYIIDKFTHNEKDTQKKCLSS